MPANLTPDYKAAEAEFRKARNPEDRLRWLREMLRTVPKHKGTEHLQADIKTRIKEITDELAGPKKGGARTGPATTVRPEGAGQVALLALVRHRMGFHHYGALLAELNQRAAAR